MSLLSELRINISNLSEGIHHRSLETEPAEIGLDSRFEKKVSVSATLEKTSRQLFLQADVRTGGVFNCDRCLEDFRKDVSCAFTIVYVSDGRAAAELEDKDVQIISPGTNLIDIGEDVRQYAILALPQKLLCKEDCAGLCPSCGSNLNRGSCSCVREEMDPRWEELKKFLEN